MKFDMVSRTPCQGRNIFFKKIDNGNLAELRDRQLCTALKHYIFKILKYRLGEKERVDPVTDAQLE